MQKIKKMLIIVWSEFKEFIGYEIELKNERDRKERVGNAARDIVTNQERWKYE